MRLQVTQENLNKALSIVGRVASSKTSLPILNNILLRAEGNRLQLAATNLEIAITQFVGGKVDEEGSITVPAKLMAEFIGNLPKGPVQLTAENGKLQVETANYKSTINGMDAEEFPALPEVKNDEVLRLPSALLKRSIQQTAIVASSDDTRPVLTGIYIHNFEGSLFFAATDGYRLAEKRILNEQKNVQAIIPSDTLQEVLRVLSEDIDEVEFMFDDAQVLIGVGDITIVSRLIDGNFPDYRQLIPNSSDISATINKDEFIRITKIASLFARESGGSVTVKVDDIKNRISIQSVASQVGENSSEIDAEVSGGGSVTLNSRYLLEALGCIDDKSVTFAFSGKLSPCILKSTSSEQDYQHIVMPLKS